MRTAIDNSDWHCMCCYVHEHISADLLLLLYICPLLKMASHHNFTHLIWLLGLGGPYRGH